MTDIIYTIITLFKNSEECRRNRKRAQYKKIYWEMERIYINNREKLKEIESLRNYWNNVWQKFNPIFLQLSLIPCWTRNYNMINLHLITSEEDDSGDITSTEYKLILRDNYSEGFDICDEFGSDDDDSGSQTFWCSSTVGGSPDTEIDFALSP